MAFYFDLRKRTSASAVDAKVAAAVEAAKAEIVEAVRPCVEGVVLYDNAEHSTSSAYRAVKIPGYVFDEYRRVEVIARFHGGSSDEAALTPKTARVVFAEEECSILGTGESVLATKAVTYMADDFSCGDFFFTFMQLYQYRNGITGDKSTHVSADSNVADFKVRLDSNKTGLVATKKPNGVSWVSVERVVGYPKLPEAAQ